MKKYLLQLLVVGLAIVVLPSCAKDKRENTDFLILNSWKRALTDKNISTNPSGKIWYQAIPICEVDDVYSFKADNTFTINNGQEKCEISENKTQTGTYHQPSKEITIKGVKYTLAEVSANQVKYYAPLASVSGYDYAVFLLQ